MSVYKEEKINGNIIHFSVGAFIKRNNQYLLIDRIKPPYGFAGIAGHVDSEETPEQALNREVNEESGLKVISQKLIFDEFIDWNKCHKFPEIGGHHWYVYECDVEGEVKLDTNESKSIEWYTVDEIKNLHLEPVWDYWFKKLEF